MNLKYLLPFDRYRIDSPLSAEEASRRMAAAVIEKKIIRLTPPESDLEGVVTAHGFHISRIAQGRNSFSATANGYIESAPGGCYIRVSVGMHPFVIVFCCIWLTMVISIGSMIAKAPPASNLILALVPAAMTLFMVVLVNGGFWYSANRLKARLNEIFEARTGPGHSPTVR